MTKKTTNLVTYFEIPVNNMDRAIEFYKMVFNFDFEREELDDYDMAFFPSIKGQSGPTGALVKGDVYQPTKRGVILYFHTDNIDETLKKAFHYGSNLLYPKTVNTTYGFAIAEIEDSEGNRIALRQLLSISI